MTFATAYIVYGIDIAVEDREGPFYLDGIDDAISELADEGLVESTHDGMGKASLWIGVKLGGIDSTSKSLEGCRLEPNEGDEAAYEAKLKAVSGHLEVSGDPGAGKLAGAIRGAKPGVFLAWGSS